MQGNTANLDGGRKLAQLYEKDPLTASLVEDIIAAVNQVGQNTASSPIGELDPPPPIDNLSVKASGEMIHAAISHSAKVKRGIRYFIEADTLPSFPRPIVSDLGSSRSAHPFTLPSLDDNGNKQSWYFRAYSQYPGSRPSVPTVLGGLQNPTAIQLQGATKMTVLGPTGSGTSSTTGQQGGSGLGKTPVSSNAVLRTGKLQGTPPVASASPGSSTSMDTIQNGPVTYFKVVKVDSTTGQATTGSLAPNSVTTSIDSSFTSVTCPAAVQTLVGNVTISASSGIAIVSASGILLGGPAGGLAILTLYKGDNTGTVLNEQSVLNDANNNGWAMANIIDTSPGASQTYSIYCFPSGGGGCSAQDTYISAINLKV